MKRIFLFSFLSVLAVFSIIGTVSAASTTLVMQGTTHTMNEVLGYQLQTGNGTTSQTDTTSVAGAAHIVSHGIRVWTVDTNGTLTEVTPGYVVAIVFRTVNGEGIQSNTWNCPSANNTIVDSLLVRVYRKFSGDWEQRATFISKPLNALLDNSTWTVYYYTVRTTTTYTSGSFRWGNTTWWSRLGNVELGDLSLWEWMDAYLKVGDFVSFILTPYFNPLGELAYGMILLLICVPIYNRTENLSYVAAVCVLFGGASGIFTLLIPTSALNLALVLFVVGFGILFYKLVMRLRNR